MSNEWAQPPRPPGERDMSGLLLSEARTGFPGHLGGIRLLKFTSDRRRFFCADLDMRVSLREGGQVLASYELDSGNVKAKALDRVHDFAVSLDGRRIFVAAGLHLRCLEVDSGIEFWRYRPSNVLCFLQASPRAVDVTKTGKVWVSSDNAVMDLFDEYGSHLASWRANDAPNMVSRMHNGDWWVGSDGYGLSVWEPEERRRILRLRSSVRVYAIKAFPTDDRVAVRSDVGVTVVDLFSGDTVRTFNTMPGLPYIDISEDGRTLLVGEGRGVAVYSLDGDYLAHKKVEGDRVLTAVFDGPQIVVGTAGGEVLRLD